MGAPMPMYATWAEFSAIGEIAIASRLTPTLDCARQCGSVYCRSEPARDEVLRIGE